MLVKPIKYKILLKPDGYTLGFAYGLVGVKRFMQDRELTKQEVYWVVAREYEDDC